MGSELKAKCKKCDTVIIYDPRNNTGCNCDPDSPTWVYIQPDGRIRGFSQAEWEIIATTTDATATDV